MEGRSRCVRDGRLEVVVLHVFHVWSWPIPMPVKTYPAALTDSIDDETIATSNTIA